MTRISRVPASRAVRVLVVDDSPICRALLRTILVAGPEPGLVVVGEAASGHEALRLARTLTPDVITMDVRMPGLGGLETIERLMDETPCPVLVVTDIPAADDGSLVFEATRRGALDVAHKPNANDLSACRVFRQQVLLLASVPVVRHMSGATRTRGRVAPEPPNAHGAASHTTKLRSSIPVIGIAASAGGPAALAVLLGGLSGRFGGCIALTQHLPVGFAAPFARYLASRTALRVVVGDRRVPVSAGTIVLAPDSAHLVAQGRDHLGPSNAPPVGGHRPSADVCFQSLATQHGSTSIGVVLSGIGRDGADGLSAMRATGAFTIAQDESTSAIYGMPRAAFENGASCRVLPLHAIAGTLVDRVDGGSR